MKIVKPGAEHDTPRGILGGAELSQATTGATNIYMAKFRVPAGAREPSWARTQGIAHAGLHGRARGRRSSEGSQRPPWVRGFGINRL